MDKQSCENHIEVLKRVRDVCSSQLDIGALTELDGVIASLESALDHRHSAEEVEKLKLRALQAIAAVVSIVTNVRHWMM